VHDSPQPLHIGDKNRQTHAIGQIGTFGPCNHFHIQEGLTNSRLITVNQRVICGIDATHAGYK
ncbi:MAG: hypothetical protein WBL86_17710, partial [Pseudolabrys sp.]